VLHFIDALHVVKDNLFEIPPLFNLIQEQSGTDWREMYKVFNMGHRMEIYLPENIAPAVIGISQAFGIDAKVIGRVSAASKRQVTVTSDKGTFTYPQ
jgi:phosphoribosylformylglycinamidine cyclo-ligase